MDSMYGTYNFNADTPLERYKKSDIGFLITMILLWGLGIFTLFFCSQNSGARYFDDSLYYVKRQLISSAIGFIGMFFFAFLNVRHIRRMIPAIVVFTIILCLLVFIPAFSEEKNGARRWLKIPAIPFTFQPSEFVKFVLVIFLANAFDRQYEIQDQDSKSKFLFITLLIYIAFVGLVICEKDFSTGFFLFCLGLVMYMVSGTKVKWLLPLSPLLLSAGILLVCLEPYRLQRIAGFFDRASGTATFNYQSIKARDAICSGGLIGNGIGSELFRLNSIPEVQADYIFAGWTEAFGFFGVVVYFIILGVFAWRGFRVASKCSNRFAAYGSLGCVVSIVAQSVVNIAVVCGVLPSTGIPLPFFSLGGSSIITTLAMCGFVLNASRCDDVEDDYYIKRQNKLKMNDYLSVELGDI
ncbi:MAG: putative lipid II flippase FtsW [Treponema sp.]|nr:putative lipid II flippase FtsW [Treponema sp.]